MKNILHHIRTVLKDAYRRSRQELAMYVFMPGTYTRSRLEEGYIITDRITIRRECSIADVFCVERRMTSRKPHEKIEADIELPAWQRATLHKGLMQLYMTQVEDFIIFLPERQTLYYDANEYIKQTGTECE